MSDDARRKRSAFIGRGVTLSPPRPQQPQQQDAPVRNISPRPAPPSQESSQRRMVQEQMAPARRQRLTADSGFASASDTPVMDDGEIDAMISESERREPGSSVRGRHDTGSMMVGGAGYREPKPGV